MGKFIRHEPCPECGSSDALARYADGGAFCFSCKATQPPQAGQGTDSQAPLVSGVRRPAGLLAGEVEMLDDRRIAEATCRRLDYRVTSDAEGRTEHIATYYDGSGRPVAQKVRTVATKEFRWRGEPKRALLFGQQLWKEGGRQVVVTEGEIDALSVYQALGPWPVVSVPNGAQSAKADLAKHIEWLETFERIVLCFDMDEPGRAAAAECAELFTPGKAAIAQLPFKDANEVLVRGEPKALARAIHEAKAWTPDGLVWAKDLLEEVLTPPTRGVAYPWKGLDDMLFGMRDGEIVTWAAGVGVGKTTFMRNVVFNLTQTGMPVGVLSFEETTRAVMLGQLGLQMRKPLHQPAVWDDTSEEDLRAAFAAYPTENLWICTTDLESDKLPSRIRYLAKRGGCRQIVLDHITAIVAGRGTDEEWKRIDAVMARVRPTVRELGITLHIVSHLVKTHGGDSAEEGGQISLSDLRGSALQRDSHTIIALERNQQADAAEAKRITQVRVLKNRLYGETGVACRLRYVPDTGELVQVDDARPAPGTTGGFSPVTEGF